MFLSWYEIHKHQGSGSLPKEKLAVIEKYFLGETQPYLCGCHDASIVDLVAFFAIVPFHRKWIMEQKDLEKLQAWVNLMEENEDVMTALGDLNVSSETDGVGKSPINAKL